MRKIPCLFIRERIVTPRGTKYLATDIVTPGCEWVMDGEGIPNLHCLTDPYQRFVNAIHAKSYMRPHRHSDDETFMKKTGYYDARRA